MKWISCLAMCLCFTVGFAQDWLTSLEVGERLALTQDKLMVVVWEDAYFNGAPVYVNDSSQNPVFINDMFAQPVLDSLLWEHFVPVILPEYEYADRFKAIENKRSRAYLDKFSDGSLKVMDANGNILNVNEEKFALDLSQFVFKYGLNMALMKTELINYKHEKTFYTAFYLATKYLDYAFYSNPNLRSELVGLATIYLEEATTLVSQENEENHPAFNQRLEFVEIEKEIILDRPKKALRKLKRIDLEEVEQVNLGLYSFLYFSSYKLLQQESEAAQFNSEVSTVDKRKLNVLLNSKEAR